MQKSAIALLCLMLCGSALAQTPQPAAGVKGSAGEAAAAVGASSAPKPESFLNQAATQNVDVSDAMMLDADRSEGWILHGRTYDNQRFSPLTEINLSNVASCGPPPSCRPASPRISRTPPSRWTACSIWPPPTTR